MREAQHHPPRPGRLFWPAGLAVVLLTAAGCTSKYTPVPVSGVVTLDGQPVNKATVYFYAVGDDKEGRPAQGATDENGEFNLSTLGNGDGALPGDYKVVVHKYVPTQPNLKIPDFPNTPEGRAERSDFIYRNFEAKGIQPFKNALPPKYGDSNTTPLNCKVAGKMTVKLELTSR
jgi:hypothetical protein